MLQHQLIMKKLILLIPILLAFGCTDADKAKIFSYGSKHHITLYGASGTKIGEWDSTGTLNDIAGDGCEFMDTASKKLVTIRGTMVITQD